MKEKEEEQAKESTDNSKVSAEQRGREMAKKIREEIYRPRNDTRITESLSQRNGEITKFMQNNSAVRLSSDDESRFNRGDLLAKRFVKSDKYIERLFPVSQASHGGKWSAPAVDVSDSNYAKFLDANQGAIIENFKDFMDSIGVVYDLKTQKFSKSDSEGWNRWIETSGVNANISRVMESLILFGHKEIAEQFLGFVQEEVKRTEKEKDFAAFSKESRSALEYLDSELDLMWNPLKKVKEQDEIQDIIEGAKEQTLEILSGEVPVKRVKTMESFEDRRDKVFNSLIKTVVKDARSKSTEIETFAESTCQMLDRSGFKDVFEKQGIQIATSNDDKKKEGMKLMISPSVLAGKIEEELKTIEAGALEGKSTTSGERIAEAAEKVMHGVYEESLKTQPEAALYGDKKPPQGVEVFSEVVDEDKEQKEGHATPSPETAGVGSEPIEEAKTPGSPSPDNKFIGDLFKEITGKSDAISDIGSLSRNQKDKLFKTLIDKAIEAATPDNEEMTVVSGDSHEPREEKTSGSLAKDVCKELAKYKDIFASQGIQIATSDNEKQQEKQVMISPSYLKTVIDKEVESSEKDSSPKGLMAKVGKAISEFMHRAYEKSETMQAAYEVAQKLRDQRRSKEAVTQRRATRDLRNSLRKSGADRGR